MTSPKNAESSRSLFKTLIFSCFLGAIAGLFWIGRPRLAFGMLMIAVIAIVLVLFNGIPLSTTHAAFAAIAVALLNTALVMVLWPNSRPSGVLSRWYIAILLGYISPLGILLIGLTFFVQQFHMSSAGMSPTLQIGDHIITYKRPLWRNQPQHGDIIAFFGPEGIVYVSRIMAKGGETIEIRNGVPIINGIALKHRIVGKTIFDGGRNKSIEAELIEETGQNDRIYSIANLTPLGEGDDMAAKTVPAGHFFVMGDNRDNSADSRFHIGFVPAGKVLSLANKIFWNSSRTDYHGRRDLTPAFNAK